MATRLMGKLYEPGLDPTDIDGSLLTIQKQMHKWICQQKYVEKYYLKQ